MKQIITATLIFLIALQGSYAQEFGFSKGSVFLEGNLQFAYSKIASTENLSLNVYPTVGYFVGEKIAIGGMVGYGYSRVTTNNQISPRRHVVDWNFFGRYYFLNIGARFKVYTQLGIGTGHVLHRVPHGVVYYNSPLGYNFLRVNAGLGLNVFLTEKIALHWGLPNLLGFQTSLDSHKFIDANLNLNIFQNVLQKSTFGLTFKLK